MAAISPWPMSGAWTTCFAAALIVWPFGIAHCRSWVTCAAKFRRELKLFERFEIHTRMLGWDAKWSFVEHRFVKDKRVIAVVVMRGLFRGRKGVVAPGEFARELGLDEQSPPLPQWLREWSASCDGLSIQLREAEDLVQQAP